MREETCNSSLVMSPSTGRSAEVKHSTMHNSQHSETGGALWAAVFLQRSSGCQESLHPCALGLAVALLVGREQQVGPQVLHQLLSPMVGVCATPSQQAPASSISPSLSRLEVGRDRCVFLSVLISPRFTSGLCS